MHASREGLQFWTQDRKYRRGSGKANGIRLATINIMSGRAGGLEAVLGYLKQGNLDVGVLQDTKLTDGIHTW